MEQHPNAGVVWGLYSLESALLFTTFVAGFTTVGIGWRLMNMVRPRIPDLFTIKPEAIWHLEAAVLLQPKGTS